MADKHQMALALLSGGLDSSSTLFMARAGGYAVSALSVDNGQRHSIELHCAKTLCYVLDVLYFKVRFPDMRGMMEPLPK